MSLGATNIDATNNALLSSLVTDQKWSVSNIEYAFAPGGTTYDDGEGGNPTSEAFTTLEHQWIQAELAEVSAVAALTFTQVSYSVSSLDFIKERNIGDQTSGYAFLPENDYSRVVLDSKFITDDGTAIHEIGHALGLDHPFDGTKLPGVRNDGSVGQFTLNNALYTRMAYNEASIHGATNYVLPEVVNLAALDIAALQSMYGANRSYRGNDDVYLAPTDTTAIWDTGGIDSIDFRAKTDATVIDLRAATLQVEEGGAGWASYATEAGSNVLEAAFTIAYGVTIENARGGSGDDAITGNAVANILEGGSGNDTLSGRGGNDTLSGGSGNDRLEGGGGFDTADYSAVTDDIVANIQFAGAQQVSAQAGRDTFASIEGLLGGSGDDLLVGSSAGNVIDGGAGNDEIYGIGGGDILRGGIGADQIEGSGGNDTMDGGAGDADVLSYFNAAGAVRVDMRSQGTAQAVGGSAGTDTFTGFEDLYGSNSGADTLIGDTGDNRILGFSGNDRLYGFDGADDLVGMKGADLLVGGRGADILSGGGGADTFDFNTTDESTGASRDTIRDFGVGGADRIDLSTIDANDSVAGNQAFGFIGSGVFTGAGDLRFVTNGTDGFVLGDIDGDGRTDINILLLGVTAMDAGDFVL